MTTDQKDPVHRITRIGTHQHPHADELLGIALWQLFGEKFFPGISTAKLQSLSEEEVQKYDPHRIDIGVGGGSFDEHEKSDGECAATLVASALELINEPKFFCLLEETRKWDNTAKADKTLIAEVLKVLYEHRETNKVIRWGIDAFTAIIEVADKGLVVVPSRAWMMEVAYEVQTRFMETHRDKNLHERVMTALSETVNNSRGRVTSISHACSALRLTSGDDIAREWLEAAFVSLYESQIDFDAALEEVKQGKRFTVFQQKEVSGQQVRVRLEGVAVHTDNGKACRAFRSKRTGAGPNGFDMLIQRNRRGNVQIFANGKSGLDLGDCAQLIRFAEAYERRQNVRFEDLAGTGTVESVPQWYVPDYGGQILNGSKSHPDKEPTRISDAKLIQILQHSFDPQGVEKLRVKLGGQIHQEQVA